MYFCSKKLFAPAAAFFIISIISIAFASPASIWTTDAFGNAKTDFAPGETVYISGDGFSALSQVSISVTRPNLVVDVCPYEWRCGDLPMTDEMGSFLYYPYVLNGIEGIYIIDASDGTNTAQVSFTDADKSHFSQCADDSDNDDVRDDCEWVAGNINANNGIYAEGEVVPQRLLLTFDDAGTYTIRITYDFTKSNIYAYDFISTPDLTQSGSYFNPCGENLPNFITSSQCSSLFSGAASVNIPSDSFDAVSLRETPSNRHILIGGVSSPSITIIGHDPSTSCFQNCGTSEVNVDITFTTSSPDSLVAIWFGVHLAQAADPDGAGPVLGWGNGFGASNISGSPFHIDAGGAQNSISIGTILPPAPVCGNGVVETGEDCDPGPDVAGDCCDALCHFETSAYECRPAAGECDIAETCSGTSADCPTTDTKSTAECRPSAGDCDVAEYCDGSNNDCPTDAFRPNTYICRASAGQCDIDDYCTGYGVDCPDNVYQPYSTVCEADSLFCTVDHCDGYGSCVYLNDYDCSDSNECTYDVCNDELDKCENPNMPDGTDCTGDPGKCCSGVCDADGTSGSGYHIDCRTGPSCVASGDWGYSIANDGSNCGSPYGYSCYDPATCSGHYYYDTCASGYCSGSANEIADDSQCDGQDCGTCCTCSSGSRSYDETQDNDCSPTLCPDGCGIDANPFTWDYANDEPNYCHALDTCTDNACQYQHQCRDNDPNDGFNGNTCGAECDQDSDCDQTTGMCDYINREYCTRDSYGTCTAECSCSYDAWSCSTEGYCENCNHCGDGVVNCGEECENSETGEKCLPEGTSVVTVINGVCYMYPEYDTCDADTCTWSGCEKAVVDENDPRYVNCTIEISEPTCGTGYVSCASGCCTTTTFQMPIYTYTPPTFNYPSYTYTPTTSWPTVSYTTTTSKTTTTMQKYTYPSFTFPTFTFPKFTIPTFSWG